LWAVTVIALLVLFGIDLALTRRPHEVSTREAMGWTVFYLALPLAFGMFIWLAHDGTQSLQSSPATSWRNPCPTDNDVIDLDTALGQQLLDVATRQAVTQIPAHHHRNHLRWEAEANER
jgi:hypothetical protein